jgi:hypothetical protein
MLAFGSESKTIQTIRGSDGIETFLSPCEELVNVGLVAYVPDKLVMGRAETAVQSNAQFHYSQVWAKMASVFR